MDCNIQTVYMNPVLAMCDDKTHKHETVYDETNKCSYKYDEIPYKCLEDKCIIKCEQCGQCLAIKQLKGKHYLSHLSSSGYCPLKMVSNESRVEYIKQQIKNGEIKHLVFYKKYYNFRFLNRSYFYEIYEECDRYNKHNPLFSNEYGCIELTDIKIPAEQIINKLTIFDYSNYSIRDDCIYIDNLSDANYKECGIKIYHLTREEDKLLRELLFVKNTTDFKNTIDYNILYKAFKYGKITFVKNFIIYTLNRIYKYEDDAVYNEFRSYYDEEEELPEGVFDYSDCSNEVNPSAVIYRDKYDRFNKAVLIIQDAFEAVSRINLDNHYPDKYKIEIFCHGYDKDKNYLSPTFAKVNGDGLSYLPFKIFIDKDYVNKKIQEVLKKKKISRYTLLCLYLTKYKDSTGEYRSSIVSVNICPVCKIKYDHGHNDYIDVNFNEFIPNIIPPNTRDKNYRTNPYIELLTEYYLDSLDEFSYAG